MKSLTSHITEHISENITEVEHIVESTDDLVKFVHAMSEKTFKQGGNGQNLLDYGLVELASHLTAYAADRPTHGPEESGFYEKKTFDTFKALVGSMSHDDVKNNSKD